ncbi:MAG: hypothetical protein HKN30_01945 [Sulfitobacter sp.]|nr:hypothetical protein [Sulfitobacter sp.]
MVETHEDFSHRLHKLGQKHAQMSRGYVNVLTRDGLIVTKPKRFRRNNSGLRMIAVVIMGFFFFKALALSSIGPQAYDDRLALMKTGNQIEQLGAVIMAPDAITQKVAQIIGPILR